MASKTDKFSSMLSGSAPSRAAANSKTLIIQNIIEGDRPEYQYLNIDNIEFNKLNDYNELDSKESIRELAEDIRRNGLLHNIVVSYTDAGTYKLISGERRLRAHKLLFEETQDAKYSSIYSLVRKGLSDIDEMIILDAANLNVRGGIGDEKKYRKATSRFIKNLKLKFSISDEEAIALAKTYATVNDHVIDKNVVLESDLNASLLSFLDNGYITKNQAYEYARLSPKLQSVIAANLEDAKNKGVAEFKKANKNLFEPAKKIRELNKNLDSQKKELQSIKDEAQETKKRISNSDAETGEELKKKHKALEQQKKQFATSIKKTEKEIEEQTIELSKQSGGGDNSNDASDNEFVSAMSGAITDELLDLVTTAEKAVVALATAGIDLKKGYLNAENRTNFRKKLLAMSEKLNKIANVLK